MPISKYFKGDGKEVMADMVRRYGPEKGKRVFYGTAANQGQAPGKVRPKKKHKVRKRARAAAGFPAYVAKSKRHKKHKKGKKGRHLFQPKSKRGQAATDQQLPAFLMNKGGK